MGLLTGRRAIDGLQRSSDPIYDEPFVGLNMLAAKTFHIAIELNHSGY
jgi:hypothetical protein